MSDKTIRELATSVTVELVAECDKISGRDIFINQILRSCSSIGANAYEANYAQSNADFINKLKVSLKECYETEYWLELLFKIKALNEEKYKYFSNKVGSIRRKLISAIENSK